MDPDRRTGWEELFSHTLFQGNFKNSVFNPDASNSESKAKVQQPGTTTQDSSELIKEVYFRYLHEKNRVLLLFLTIKKLRQVMKDPDFYETHKHIYMMMVILAKKASILSEVALYTLTCKNNLYKMEGFDLFIGSAQCEQVKELLRVDRELIHPYHNYILDCKAEVYFTPDDESSFNWVNGSYLDLKQLDDKSMFYFYQILDLGQPAKLNFNPEENRKFHLAMYLVIQSIRSEALLPFVNNGQKFSWPDYKVRVESMSPENLKQLVYQLSRN